MIADQQKQPNDLVASWLKPEEYPLWDTFVAQHPLGLIYHLSSWKDALERAFSHIRGHFLVLRRKGSNEIEAGIPVYVVRSWLLGNRLVSIPYASICDPLISSAKQFQQLLPFIIALQKETSSHHIEIRTLKTAVQTMNPIAIASDQLLHHYLPLDQSPDDLQKRFSNYHLRTIKRAKRDGLYVKQVLDESSLKSFHCLNTHGRKRLGLPPIPFYFFESIAQSFGCEQIIIFLSILNDDVIAAQLALCFKGILHLEYYGGNPMAYKHGASYLLTWEAIKYSWYKGYRLVSFGRTDLWNNGLLNFKRHWATSEEPISISRISGSCCSPEQYKSVKRNMMSRWVFGNAPQPLCEALAFFIYRHHG